MLHIKHNGAKFQMLDKCSPTNSSTQIADLSPSLVKLKKLQMI